MFTVFGIRSDWLDPKSDVILHILHAAFLQDSVTDSQKEDLGCERIGYYERNADIKEKKSNG